MSRARVLGLLALVALALPVPASGAEPPPDPTPLWSQYPLEPTTPVPGAAETEPPPPSTAEPPATSTPPATIVPPVDTAPAEPPQTAPDASIAPPASVTTTPAVSPAGSVEDAPVAAVPQPVTSKARDLTWILVGLSVLLMLASAAWAVARNARAAPARRPTPLVPRNRAHVERCSVVCERTRGHARFAAVVEDPEGTARIVARSPAFRAAAGKPPRPDGRPLAAYEALMTALAEERWRPTGTMRTVHDEGGPERGTPEWYEEQLERIAAARARTRDATSRRAR